MCEKLECHTYYEVKGLRKLFVFLGYQKHKYLNLQKKFKKIKTNGKKQKQNKKREKSKPQKDGKIHTHTLSKKKK